jgi:hypothetical protein
VKTYFLDPIKSFADAEGFFFCLHQDGLLFHPEDDPSTVINGQSGAMLFSDSEVPLIRQRIDEAYEFMNDPCEFILRMTESDFQR